MAYNFNFTESGYTPDSYDFNFLPPVFTYRILIGTSNNFTAICADVDAGLSTGRVFIASSAAFSVVNNTILIDAYTSSLAGRTNESLDQEDIIDINA